MKLATFSALALLASLPASALAQGTAPDRKAMAALHKSMSGVHLEVAACLESNRPIADCQKIMATQCSAMKGGGPSGMHKGMMGHGMGTMGCPMTESGTGIDSQPPKP